MAASDAKIPVKDQPYAVDASPTALSLGYIADSDPEEDPEDESEDGPKDYPADRVDDDDDSSRDDADDEDEEDASEEDKEKEEEEHLASADSTVVSLLVDLVPSAEETEPFETDESAWLHHHHHLHTVRLLGYLSDPRHIYHFLLTQVAKLLALPTPPPSLLTPLSSSLPQTPPPPTSPTYGQEPLGCRVAMIRVASPPTHHPLPSPTPLPPLLLPSTARRADIPKADIPPRKRLLLAAPKPRFEVGESSDA
ncbi:hypothetical protein Tco_0177571, partial [Tanacetum coccineum]